LGLGWLDLVDLDDDGSAGHSELLESFGAVHDLGARENPLDVFRVHGVVLVLVQSHSNSNLRLRETVGQVNGATDCAFDEDVEVTFFFLGWGGTLLPKYHDWDFISNTSSIKSVLVEALFARADDSHVPNIHSTDLGELLLHLKYGVKLIVIDQSEESILTGQADLAALNWEGRLFIWMDGANGIYTINTGILKSVIVEALLEPADEFHAPNFHI